MQTDGIVGYYLTEEMVEEVLTLKYLTNQRKSTRITGYLEQLLNLVFQVVAFQEEVVFVVVEGLRWKLVVVNYQLTVYVVNDGHEVVEKDFWIVIWGRSVREVVECCSNRIFL